MGYLLGENVQLGVGVESVRGTPVQPQAWIPARTPTGIRVAMDKVTVQETKSSRITSQGTENTQKRVEGDVEFNIRSNSFGYFLLSLLGSVQSSPVMSQSGAYEHQFDVALCNPQNPALTLAISRCSGFQDYKYPLAVVSQLEINTPVDDLANATASFVGKDEQTNTDYSPAFPSDDVYFRNYEITIKIADDVAGLDAASALKVKELSLTINNNARTNQNIGELNPSDVLALLFEITGSMSVDFQDEIMHDIYVNNTAKAMRIEMVRSDVIIGVSINPKITIDLSKVTFTSLEQDRPIDDIVMDTIEFQAHYDEDTARAIRATIINDQADYTAVGS